jgi:hypothetical protein
MTVGQLIEKLSKFDPNTEVTISDGYYCKFYRGSYTVEEFEGAVDIGIGGTEE